MTFRDKTDLNFFVSDTLLSCNESECLMVWTPNNSGGIDITVFKENIENIDSYVHEFSEITIQINAKALEKDWDIDCSWVADAMLDESYLKILMEKKKNHSKGMRKNNVRR